MSDRLDDLKARIAALEEQKRLPDIVPLQRELADATGEELGTESALYVAALNELGSLLRSLKQLDESEEAFLKAAGIEGRVRGTEANADYATCINNLAGTYRLMGQFEKAEALFRESMDIYAADGRHRALRLPERPQQPGPGLPGPQALRRRPRPPRAGARRAAEAGQARHRLRDHAQQPGLGLHGDGPLPRRRALPRRDARAVRADAPARTRCSTSPASTTWPP